MARSVSPQSSWDDAPMLFPVPIERRAETGSMPAPRTSFVGREREVGPAATRQHLVFEVAPQRPSPHRRKSASVNGESYGSRDGKH